MPLTVQCACGKRMGVSDALAGRTVRCPKCGESVFVSGAAASPAAAGRKQQAAPALYMSKGKIVALAALGVLLVIGIVFYLGPMRVSSQWSAMEPKAGGSIRNLITFALRGFLSERGEFDPGKPRFAPSIGSQDISYFQPLLAMSMPEKVSFIGKSSQGTFSGTYDTRSGEVDADVSYGGYSIAGLVDVKKPTGKFHMVGREVNGRPDVEIDGKKVKNVYENAGCCRRHLSIRPGRDRLACAEGVGGRRRLRQRPHARTIAPFIRTQSRGVHSMVG